MRPVQKIVGGLTLLCAGLAAPASAEEAPEAAVNEAFTPPDRSLFAEGEYVYERNCRDCHGVRGDGQGPLSLALPAKPRAFSTGLFKYRSTPWGKLPSTDDIIRTIRSGRTGTAMGMFTHLSENEIRAVAEYVKSFSRKWRKPENYALPIELP